MAVDTSRASERLRAWNEGDDDALPRGYTHDSLDFQRDLRDLLARAEAAEGRCDLFGTQAAAAKIMAANAEAQRDAATAERDALRDEWEEIAAGITTEQPEVGALWPMVSEISGNLAAARNLFRNEVAAHNRTKAQRDAAIAERDRLAEALGFYACECAAHGDDCDGQHDAMYCGWRAKAALASINKDPTDGE